MIYPSNDATPGDYPSLFDKTSAAGTATNTISILSAATGGDGIPPYPQKNNIRGRFTRLFLLIATGLAGWAYWHFNHATFDRAPQASPILSQPKPLSSPIVRAEIVPTPGLAYAPSGSLERTDIAVVEVMKDASVKPAPYAAALMHAPAVRAFPKIKSDTSTKSLVPQTKSSVPLVKNRLPQKDGVRTPDTVASVAFIKDASPIKSKVAAQQSVVIVRSTTDTDEKLLEGILRLIKRDDAQEP